MMMSSYVVFHCRYNSLGQLSCVICNQTIKSNILWTSHLKNRKHKDMVAALKAQKKGVASSSAVSVRTPSTAPVTPSLSSHTTTKMSQGKERVHEEAEATMGSSRKRDLPVEVGKGVYS